MLSISKLTKDLNCATNFFSNFFLIGKVISLKAKRVRKEYTRSIPRYKGVKHQRANKPHPYLVASQSTKSIKEKVCSFIYAIAQFTKVYKKMDLISWSFLSISLKALPFLSFQMVHIKQRGAALQAFSLFLPTKEPCQPGKFLFTEECITHCTPKREKIKSHNILAFSQNKRRWSMVSSSFLHKKHLLGMLQPNLLRLTKSFLKSLWIFRTWNWGGWWTMLRNVWASISLKLLIILKNKLKLQVVSHFLFFQNHPIIIVLSCCGTIN